MTNSATIIGNLGRDPEVRFTKSGKQVADFTVAATPRRKDGDQWVDDGDPFWVRVTVWEKLAENVGDSLHKGDRVICTGRLRVETYEGKDGHHHTCIEMTADEVAVTLRFAAVKVQRVEREKPAVKTREPIVSTDDI